MLAFGEYTVDPLRYELRHRGAIVHVEPQVFDVLRCLLERRDRVVTRDDLLDEVWGDRFVSDTTLSSRIKAARRAIGDDGDAQRWIRTVRGRGYEFVGDVRETDAPHAARHDASRADPHASRGASAPVDATDDETLRFCRGTDGVRIAYALTGAGPPLVKAANWLTHLGFDGRSLVWRHWIDELSRRHTLVRYDERGCGLSSWEVPSFTFGDWVNDLERVVDAEALDRFALLGISQGAAVAIAYAAAHPERVTRLALISGYAVGRGGRALTDHDRAAAALDIELARVGWTNADPAIRRVFAAHFYPHGPPELWEAFDELQARTTSPENVVRFLEQFGRIDVRSLAPLVHCPTLIAHARGDRRQPFACATELQELIRGSRLVALPSDNHLTTPGEPAWPVLLDELEAFFGEGGTDGT